MERTREPELSVVSTEKKRDILNHPEGYTHTDVKISIKKRSFHEPRTSMNIRISEDLIPVDQENIEMHNFSHVKRIQKLLEGTVPVI